MLGDGELNLINEAQGSITNGEDSTLYIDTGANTIMNAGLIGEAGTGGIVVRSAVYNTGKFSVANGELTFDAAVSGSGIAAIFSGVLKFNSTFSENVVFDGSTGKLYLADSQAYTGEILGFAKAGGTYLDLGDVAFKKGITTATFAPTANARGSGGVLTVTDGVHVASFQLVGNFLQSTFVLGGDGSGGTVITTRAAPQPGAFVSAMAAFAAPAAGSAHLEVSPVAVPSMIAAGHGHAT